MNSAEHPDADNNCDTSAGSAIKIEEPGVLEHFIADEDAALLHDKEGEFYPINKHLIVPLLPAASSSLTDATRQRLYFHLLRVGELPPIQNLRDFELLSAAYRQVVPLLNRGPPTCNFPRTLGLLVFGYDEQGVLPEEAECSLTSYQNHTAIWAYCNGHRAIRYMINKADEFRSYANDVALAVRILKVLRHVKYIHTEHYRAEARYPITRLWFWGLIFIALLNARTAEAVVGDFLAPLDKLPRYQEQLNILGIYLEAIPLHELRARVSASQRAASS